MKTRQILGLLLLAVCGGLVAQAQTSDRASNQADNQADNQLSDPAGMPAGPSAEEIVRAAVDQWRGQSSYSEMTMTIHRPDWERSMSMRGWTQGMDRSLVRITEPAKDAGNATLTRDNNMWTFSPKVNRVIKVPSSMMSQSWMGSDFSNKDISRSDEIIDSYRHQLIETVEANGHTVYSVESVPHESAAVVWGRQVLRIRDDWILLREDFYDQDDILVKSLLTLDIDVFDGRTVASHQRMEKAETAEEWTEIQIHDARFAIDVSDRLFTLANLRNPREGR